MFIETNLNPLGKSVGDCTIRAIALLTGDSWDNIFIDICVLALRMADMPSSNAVWSTYLSNRGYIRRSLPNTCPFCYSVKDFCIDHPSGTYLLATGSHVVTCIDGNYHDTWDSGDENPVYFWVKGESEDAKLS